MSKLTVDTDIDKRFADLRLAILNSDCSFAGLAEAMHPYSNAELGSFRALGHAILDEVSEELGRRKTLRPQP